MFVKLNPIVLLIVAAVGVVALSLPGCTWGGGAGGVAGSQAQVCSAAVTGDGSGGAIVLYEVLKDSEPHEGYIQRIDADGNRLWGEKGMLVYTWEGAHSCSRVVSGGEGSAILATSSGGTTGS